MTEHNHYEPNQDDFDVFEELYNDPKGNGAGMWTSPASMPQPVEQPLSDSEIEERQRIGCIAELLEGRFDRPIRPSLDTLAQKLLALSRPYQPTELPNVLPTLRDKLVTASLAATQGPNATGPATAAPHSYDPVMANWTLYEVWQHQL